MEANKENVHITRIPIPKNPLPAIPRHLLVDNKKMSKDLEIIPTRHPLKTINSDIIRPGPSKEKAKTSIKIDTKHVTMRIKNDDLDWNYAVFKRRDSKNDANSTIITISDDECLEEEEMMFVVGNQKKGLLGEALTAVTPIVKDTLEPQRVRNMKRSLKRPHSRELQGLSPPVKNDKIDVKAKNRSLFNSRMQDILGLPDFWNKAYMRCMNRDYTHEIMEYLMDNEKKPLGVPRTSSITRACVINWLMKVNGPDGNPAVIQTACWYLDSILGTTQVQLDKLQLVAAACFWISQKLHGPVSQALRLVRYADRAFSGERLLAAEKTVLLKLSFPTQPIVAQDFITYLSWWTDTNHGGEIELAATFLCQCGLMVDKVLCEEYPSVVAAAAVRNAVLLLQKKELMSRLQNNEVYQAAEKKSTKFSFICSILRRAVRIVSDLKYEYKTPLEQFGGPPHYLAQYIVTAVNELAVMDARNTEM